MSEEQKDILQKRGVLTPEELHRLASKTRNQMGADDARAECHSEVTGDSDSAMELQDQGTSSPAAPPPAGD